MAARWVGGRALGSVPSPVCSLVTLSATSLGLVAAVLKDAGRVDGTGSAPFLGALPLVRGRPASLWACWLGGPDTAASALLQATSLPFIVYTGTVCRG